MTTVQLTEKKNIDDLLEEYKQREREARELNEQIRAKMNTVGLL